MVQWEVKNRKFYFLGFIFLLFISTVYVIISPRLEDCNEISSTPQASGVFDNYQRLEWNRSFSAPCIGGSLWGDKNNVYTVSTKGEFVGDWQYLLLTKWDKKGQIIWEEEWGITLEDQGLDIWGDDQYLYTCGTSVSPWTPTENSSSTFLIIKWNKDGDEIWSKRWNSGMFDYSHRIWGDNNYIYLLGSSTNTTNFHPSELDCNVSIWKIDFDGNLIWNRTWEWNYLTYDVMYSSSFGIVIQSIFGIDMCMDEDHIYIAHSEGINLRKFDKDGNLLFNNSYGIFNDTRYSSSIGSICEETDFLYIARSHEITKIEKIGNFIWNKTIPYFWNTTTETIEYHEIMKIGTNGKDFFTTGRVYFEDAKEEMIWWESLSFHRWDSNGNLLGYETWHPYRVLWGIWGDGMWIDGDAVYLTAQIWQDIRYFVKWDLNPPYFLYFGVPPMGLLAVGTVLWFWIKPIKQYKRKMLAEQVETINLELDYSNHQDGLVKLNKILPSLEELNDSKLLEKWQLVHKKWEKLDKRNRIDLHFKSQLKHQEELVVLGEIKGAYDNLVKLLREANSESYVSFVDKSIVSDITDLLKTISDKIEN